MSKNNIIEFEYREASTDPLNELLQAGAPKPAIQESLAMAISGAKASNRHRAGNG